MKRYAEYVSGRTLDLGAGNAKYAYLIKPHATEYVTCDVMPGPNIDFVEDVHNLSFPDESFDTVVCTQVLEHVKEPWVVAEQIARVLRPGGYAIVSAPFLIGYHADPHDYFRFTDQGFKYLFERLNMEVVKSIPFGGIFVILNEMYKLNYCNQYIHKNPGRLRLLLFRLFSSACRFCDRWFPDPKFHYANNFLIVRSPK